MQGQKVTDYEFEFYFPDLDNLLLVQCAEDGAVTIRSTRNNVSESRKLSFIRQLAAEGFIPDTYQWFPGTTDGSLGLKWVVDCSWLKIPSVVVHRSNRFIRRALLAGCALWLGMMGILLVSAKARKAMPISNQSIPSETTPGPKPTPANYFVPESR